MKHLCTCIVNSISLTFIFSLCVYIAYTDTHKNYHPRTHAHTHTHTHTHARQLSLLIFIENQLTVLLVNKPEHKLQKEVGYHFDLLIVAILAGICGLLGLPWVCAASIRSVQHLQALSVFTTKNPPGEKPRLLYVYEQRVTNIVVHFLISELLCL